MVRGINVLANAVKVTLGPKGRNVVLDRAFGAPTVTHFDGGGDGLVDAALEIHRVHAGGNELHAFVNDGLGETRKSPRSAPSPPTPTLKSATSSPKPWTRWARKA